MSFLGFTIYYLGLRLRAFLGIYRNTYPLDVRWRWKNWQRGRKNHGQKIRGK